MSEEVFIIIPVQLFMYSSCYHVIKCSGRIIDVIEEDFKLFLSGTHRSAQILEEEEEQGEYTFKLTNTQIHLQFSGCIYEQYYHIHIYLFRCSRTTRTH